MIQLNSIKSMALTVTPEQRRRIRDTDDCIALLIDLGVVEIRHTYHSDDLLTIEQFAKYIGRKPETIRKIRKQGASLPKELGDSKTLIRYRKKSIDEWLETNKHMSEEGAS